ncbi:bifunctional 3'-5' exonuclease/DNA polymerase [Iningainema sp. BLCCT55]|uniref:DNA polymerase I n=2 Tax=Iningainema TaxID=1932705 RepID=A0A8J6XS22_9CYAN|nr:bifunctional 3'-5' exonuclease/DNA polymerase [Iningainema tapete]MBD2772603.1 bifunctional 3'-5' exonuclease/DNA polymerase [Iningainema tapete BLCC-T55]
MNLTLNTIDMQYQLVQDAQTLESVCQSLAAAKVIGIDTETTGLDPRTHRLRLVQIAAKGMPVMIVDLAAIPVDKLKPLKQLLTNGYTKVFHNGKFDWSFLSMANLQPTGPYFDTQLASQVLFAGLKKSHTLAALASKFLKTELNKDLQHSDFSGKLSNDQLEYAAIDAAILLPLQKILYAHLKRASLLPTAFLEFEAMPTVAQMELNGMQLDHQKWLAVSLDLEAKKQVAALQLKELKIRHSSQLSLLPEYTDRVNLESPQQVLAALQSKGIPIDSTSKKTLIPLASQYPIIRALLDYRKLSKITSTNLLEYVHPVTGRIHAQYRQCGARSGRFSCRSPNLQNIPREKAIRSCFVASPGYKIIKADYSQIELRITAVLSGDRRMIKAYQQGRDLHALTAALITGKSLTSITAEDRRLAKAINFGLIYGMGAAKLQLYAETEYGVMMTLEEAQRFRKRFFQAYSGVAKWHDRIRCTVYGRGIREIRTIGGRRRRWANKPRLSELLNHPVQGTSADITKIAIAKLFKTLGKTGAKLIGTVHDEIILECPEQQVAPVSKILHKCMLQAAAKFLNPLPVLIEVHIA